MCAYYLHERYTEKMMTTIKKPLRAAEPVELNNPVENEDDTTAVPKTATSGKVGESGEKLSNVRVTDSGQAGDLKPGDTVTIDAEGKITKVKPAMGSHDILGDPLDAPRNIVVATVLPTMRGVIDFALDNGLWFSSQQGPIHPEDVLKALTEGKKLWQVLGVDAHNPAVLQQMRGGDLSSVELVDPHNALRTMQANIKGAEAVVNRINRRLGKPHKMD